MPAEAVDSSAAPHALKSATVRIGTGIAILVAAIMLTWPAFFNGYPLVAPDTFGFVTDSGSIISAILHPWSHHPPDMRAEFYDLGIFFLHWGHWLWPVVAFNALLSAAVLWCLIKYEATSKPITVFLAVVMFLAITTGLSWYASTVLTDIFGVFAYLGLYLLVFRFEVMTSPERGFLAAAAWWGIVVHTSHLLVSLALCGVLILAWIFRWKPIATRGKFIAAVVSLVVFATLSQFIFHRFLYGKASLSGNPPPYLMARMIADGPAALYLQQNCSHLDWVVCKHVANLPHKEDAFLWYPDGIWATATPAERDRLRKEEGLLVLATMRTYPEAQLHQSWRNFRQQLTSFSLYESATRPPWLVQFVLAATHGSGVKYQQSRQALGSLPVASFSDLQDSVCNWSAIALLVLLPLAWIRRRRDKFPLAIVIFTVLLANAFVCGVISAVSARYQGRVIWLLPLLAILLAIDLFQLRPAGNAAQSLPQ